MGYPYNAHMNSVSDVIAPFDYAKIDFSDEARKRLENLDTYAVAIFRIVNNVVTPVDVTYLYSIPSYGGDSNGSSNS